MLSKIRYYVPKNILLSVYYSIFSSHMTYGCQVWGQGDSQMIKRINNLQNKAIKLIHFKSFDKFQDHVHLSNNLFVYNYLNKNLPDAFVDSVNITHSQHNYQTRNTTKHLLNLPQVNTTKYGLNSIIYKSIFILFFIYVNFFFFGLFVSVLQVFPC